MFPLGIFQFVSDTTGSGMQFLEDCFKVLFMKEGFEDAFKDHNAKTFVQDRMLEHVKEHGHA